MSSSLTPALISALPCLYPTFACLLTSIRERQIVKSYEGYQVLRVNISTPSAFESVKNIFLSEEYDFWSSPSMFASTDIMVPPQLADTLKTFLGLISIPFDVIYNNLQDVIDFEKTNYLVRGVTQMNWETYHSVETIHGWMDAMALQYPNLVSVETYGNSTEGRPMKVMKISTSGSMSNKSAIWLDGGIHAREWISPATVTYMANELIQQATRKRTHRLLDSFDYYIVPVMNPDGYAYTMSGDRMWRKTRSVPKSPGFGNLFGWCKGNYADPNRNWAYQWGGKGTSKNQCSPIFHGDTPSSEPEVAATQNYIMSIKDNLKLFLTFHSYSQLLLLPWGYENKRADDHEELMAVGIKALQALETAYGTRYKIGATAEMLYAAAGGSFDWAKAVCGVKYAYAFELRDTGRNGFLLPPHNIIPSGKETFLALKSMAEDMMKIYRIGDGEVQVNENNRLFQDHE